MSKYIITSSQFQMLMETGAANAAMDLDIYVQPVEHDHSAGNENIESAIKDVISKLEELNNMFKVGKKIKMEQKNRVFSVLDELNNIYQDYTSKP